METMKSIDDDFKIDKNYDFKKLVEVLQRLQKVIPKATVYVYFDVKLNAIDITWSIKGNHTKRKILIEEIMTSDFDLVEKISHDVWMDYKVFAKKK